LVRQEVDYLRKLVSEKTTEIAEWEEGFNKLESDFNLLQESQKKAKSDNDRLLASKEQEARELRVINALH
jgi:hypothetical protein